MPNTYLSYPVAGHDNTSSRVAHFQTQIKACQSACKKLTQGTGTNWKAFVKAIDNAKKEADKAYKLLAPTFKVKGSDITRKVYLKEITEKVTALRTAANNAASKVSSKTGKMKTSISPGLPERQKFAQDICDDIRNENIEVLFRLTTGELAMVKS